MTQNRKFPEVVSHHWYGVKPLQVENTTKYQERSLLTSCLALQFLQKSVECFLFFTPYAVSRWSKKEITLDFTAWSVSSYQMYFLLAFHTTRTCSLAYMLVISVSVSCRVWYQCQSIGFRFSYVFCEAPGNILATMMLRNQLKAFSCLEVLIVKTERISSCFCLYNCHIRSGNYATLVTTQLIIAATHMVIFPFPLSFLSHILNFP